MPKRRYIVGPVYDWVWFLSTPMLALAAGILASDTWLSTEERAFFGQDDTLTGFFIGAVIHAHLVAVVFRSHANPTVFRRHPVRFLLVPALLWAALMWSEWIAVVATIVATFWDVYHSGAQTFGFARIYDRNAGAPAHQDRALDFWMNQLLYAGPILAGATLVDHIEVFAELEPWSDPLSTSVPAHVSSAARYLTWGVLAVSAAFVVAYAMVYWRHAQRGYRPPWLKLWLVGSTGFVSIYTWGFNTWGEAFLIMNLFHAVQYLALVWAMERDRIANVFRVPGRPRLALALYLAGVGAYGLGVQAVDASMTVLWAITIVCSLMHFWYDAFVWSVRKAQV